MTQPDFISWLNRKPSQKKPRKPLRKRTPKRAKEERQYNARVKVWLKDHTVCELWCDENGWSYNAPRRYVKEVFEGLVEAKDEALFKMGAPRSNQCHHQNKRRGARLLDEQFWMALSPEGHERIEGNKKWARENGYLLNF